MENKEQNKTSFHATAVAKDFAEEGEREEERQLAV